MIAGFRILWGGVEVDFGKNDEKIYTWDDDMRLREIKDL